MRGKSNRRKAPKRTFKMPRLRINWRRVLAVPLVVAVCVAAYFALGRAMDGPVRQLAIEAPFQRVTSMQIEAVVGSQIGRGFLSVDLAGLRAQLEAIDWVQGAVVWRRWPGTLGVRITEHTAAARWGETGLLNVNGELFTEDSRFAYPELPLLDGPDGSERRIAELYLGVRDRLADAQLQLTTLRMDERGALTFELAGGQQVRVGREALDERLERFFAIARPSLSGEFESIAFIDLRYSNGFSVGWHAQADAALALNAERS